ncbi:Dabb family protein [Anaeromyxobacter sp. SG17]|uniref:Dabb family protein n=1 Tax=Anaeromyxobacter sp. SG17 TaxID=2925405 RepID=UPI001F580087|nr:Dabb family protein [Anaeromyxobacter sp. SG17]
MVKHIVFWTLKERAEGGSREENARRVKAALEGLAGRIPGLLEIEVGIDFARSEASFDVALYSTFVDRAALDAYQAHPEHRAVADLIARVRENRAVVDYEARG